MNLTNRFNLPAPLVEAVRTDPYSRGDADISVTGLLDPPRKVVLEQQFGDQLTEDVSDKLYSLLGQGMHAIIERGAKAAGYPLVEERMYFDCLGWRVSGQFDYMDNDGVLWDWKQASVYEMQHGIKPDRERQLNVYAYMARVNGYTVTGLRDVFVLRDWHKGEVGRTANYPPWQGVVYPARMWAEDEVLAFIEDRVRKHQDARNALPECTMDERWAKPDAYAVHRAGSARASRVFTTHGAAVNYISERGWRDASIEKRQGQSTRCQSYCAALAVCAQGQACVGGQ